MRHLKIVVTVAMVMGLLQPLYAATQESAAAPQPVSEEFAAALRAKERSELGAEIRRSRSGRITFMPLEAFQALQELSSDKRKAFHVSEEELASYAEALEFLRRFHQRLIPDRLVDGCHEMLVNHAEYTLVRDEEILASGPKVSLLELLNRAQVAFVARVEGKQVGFAPFLGTRMQYRVVDVLRGNAEPGWLTEYVLPSLDFWLDGQRFCEGWQAQHKEEVGDSVLVLAAERPVAGKFTILNVFPIVDGIVLPEPLPFLDGKSLDLSEIE